MNPIEKPIIPFVNRFLCEEEVEKITDDSQQCQLDNDENDIDQTNESMEVSTDEECFLDQLAGKDEEIKRNQEEIERLMIKKIKLTLKELELRSLITITDRSVSAKIIYNNLHPKG